MPDSLHIKCNGDLSDDESDEVVVHHMNGELLLEIYQGPGLGAHRTQTALTKEAAKRLRSFLNDHYQWDHCE